MRDKLTAWIESYWYGKSPFWPLLPLQPLYVLVSAFRSLAYSSGLFRAWQAPIPVLVVGNISVGGTGKTPLTIALIEAAQQANLRVGVVSRGYGRKTTATQLVGAADIAATVGDEPLLIHQRTHVPVAVSSKRSDAARVLLANYELDMLVADDGLQHYALARDAEVVVVDSLRGFGNQWRLPCGPLREPVTRLNGVDAIVVNQRGGEHSDIDHNIPLSSQMTLHGDKLVNLVSGEEQPLESFVGKRVCAIAGIGNPAVFFNKLASLDMAVDILPFADHADYKPQDLPAADKTVVMTEKDAVKLKAIALAANHHDCWYLPVAARLTDGFAQKVITQALSAFKENKIK